MERSTNHDQGIDASRDVKKDGPRPGAYVIRFDSMDRFISPNVPTRSLIASLEAGKPSAFLATGTQDSMKIVVGMKKR
ncbi:MAG: hypothetical protein HZA64_05785 [Rhodocyclales bacterium]|nr:hypothetical protein [Rhodocyclales bacterium]